MLTDVCAVVLDNTRGDFIILFYNMKEEIKKLESRQDVLDVWVSKWAVVMWKELHKISRIKVVWNIVEVNKCAELYFYNIYEILYSPESNFFEVMNSLCDRKNTKYPNIMKVICVTSSDPLQYLKDNLNETLGF